MGREVTQFKEGNSGRPPGSQNKLTATLKDQIEAVLNKLGETLVEDLQKMKPERRVELWAQLQEYIRPKLSRTAIVGDADAPLRGVVQVEVIGQVRPPTTREQDVQD